MCTFPRESRDLAGVAVLFASRYIYMYTHMYITHIDLGVYLKSHNCGFVAVLSVFSMLFIIYVYYVYYVYLKFYLYVNISIYKKVGRERPLPIVRLPADPRPIVRHKRRHTSKLAKQARRMPADPLPPRRPAAALCRASISYL